MLILSEPIEQLLVTTAQDRGVTVEQLLLDAFANPMVAKTQSLPRPTSYPNDNIELQRGWRDEW